jgi:chaperone modulatory protein CbpM
MTAMSDTDLAVLDAIVVEEQVSFSFTELCQASRGSDTQLRALVEEDILQPRGQGPGDWVFHGTALHTARTALRLTRDLQLGVEGTALVLELLAQNEALRARLRRAGLL